jgi:hypothetical protein
MSKTYARPEIVTLGSAVTLTLGCSSCNTDSCCAKQAATDIAGE